MKVNQEIPFYFYCVEICHALRCAEKAAVVIRKSASALNSPIDQACFRTKLWFQTVRGNELY